MRIPLHTLLAFAIVFLSTSPLLAQVTTNNPKSDVDAHDPAGEDSKMFWLSLGGGGLGPGLGGDAKATYSWSKESITAKIIGASNFNIFSGPINWVNEVGVYYGRQDFGKYSLAKIAGGISYFTGLRTGNIRIHEFGIGLDGDVMLKFKVIGLSLMGSLMITPDFFYGGIFINVNLGKLE